LSKTFTWEHYPLCNITKLYAMKIYAASVEALKKRKDRVKLNSPQKLRSPHP
jgi:hypothetical protein